LTGLLQLFGVVERPMTKRMEDRVRYLNAARNGIAHGGVTRALRGLNGEQSERYNVVILLSVIPAIVRRILGQLLGFTPYGLGSASQHLGYLKRFFEKGAWGDWKLEGENFETYFYGPSVGE
jgi:hypothetical protein